MPLTTGDIPRCFRRYLVDVNGVSAGEVTPVGESAPEVSNVAEQLLAVDEMANVGHLGMRRLLSILEAWDGEAAEGLYGHLIRVTRINYFNPFEVAAEEVVVALAGFGVVDIDDLLPLRVQFRDDEARALAILTLLGFLGFEDLTFTQVHAALVWCDQNNVVRLERRRFHEAAQLSLAFDPATGELDQDRRHHLSPMWVASLYGQDQTLEELLPNVDPKVLDVVDELAFQSSATPLGLLLQLGHKIVELDALDLMLELCGLFGIYHGLAPQVAEDFLSLPLEELQDLYVRTRGRTDETGHCCHYVLRTEFTN